MAPMFCLCRVLLPNSKYGIRMLQIDSGMNSIRYGEKSFKKMDYISSTAVRHQSTKMGQLKPGSLPKRRTKKKVADVIRVEGESVSEGKAKVTRLNQHSIERTLGILPEVSTPASGDMVADFKSSSTSLKTSNSVSDYLGEEVSFEKFSNLLKNDSVGELPTIRDVSEGVRWNKGLTHTYDASFMMTDNLVSGGEVFSNSYLDFCVGRELRNNEMPRDAHCSAHYLSALSSPLAGFAQVNEIDILKETSPSVKDKAVSTSKPKKKVLSSKKKTDVKKRSTIANDNKKTTPKMSTRNSQAELNQSIMDMEDITFHIGNSEEDEYMMEELTEAACKLKGSNEVRNNTKRQQYEQQYLDMLNMKQQCRDILFQQTLQAYLSVCVNVGLQNRALHTLLYYRHRGLLGLGIRIESIEPYNIVLQGFSDKRNYEKMEEIRSLLEQDMIAMNENSYASYLICLGHQPPSNANTENILKILDIMEKAGIDIHKIFTAVKYINYGYNGVLKAVRRVNPNYVVKEEQVISSYDCHLLDSLNDTLHSSKVRPPLAGLATEDDLENWTEEQLAMELSGEVSIASVEQKEENSDIRYFREKFSRWEGRWKEALHSDFVRRVESMKQDFSSNRNNKRMTLYPYLVSLPPEQFVQIMMQEISFLACGSEGYSLSRQSLYKRIGGRVFQSYLIYHKKNNGVLSKLRALYKRYASWMIQDCHGDGVSYIPRVQWEELVHGEDEGSSLYYSITEWPNNIILAIGQFLYSLLLRNVMVWKPLHNEKHAYPAFYEIDRTYNYRILEEIKPAPVLLEVYRRSSRQNLNFSSFMGPMVVPPVPWTSRKSGGYLINSSPFVRLPYNALKQLNMMDKCKKQQLFPAMDTLNQLGSVPWRVNVPILDLMIKIFNDKGWKELGIPLPMSEFKAPPKITSAMCSAEKKILMRKGVEYQKVKSEMFALWCDALYKLSFANHFRDRIMWFPHNMDFRGRVYPIPPYFNHMGSDVFRSLLVFARGEKLGSRGLRWLKLHLVNLTGHKKREAVEERLKYFDIIVDDVIDSAEKPLTGRQWWTTSDEPWQTLAACKEVTAAIRSGNPEEYVSHLPIHQDGSCNGLQHYAALGRDIPGAVSVNLTPSKTPQDVYSAVAELVEKARIRDVVEGNKIASDLDGFVKRKVIKQTVMTTVYGVTRFGARLQIEKQLKDLSFPPNRIWAASYYLSQKTFESLEQMFTSAKEIQDWFTDCARSVSKTCVRGMEWVTPLGLPVVQHYTVPIREKCPTVKLGVYVNIDYIMQPNTMKQRNAFPPNFIHSLDSCHMMLTSIYSQKADISFASVHDCFWTHAATVDVMNKICREQFVALHNEPILEDLSDYLMSQFSFDDKEFKHDGSARDMEKLKLNTLLRKIPKKGDLDIKQVLDSIYFFS